MIFFSKLIESYAHPSINAFYQFIVTFLLFIVVGVACSYSLNFNKKQKLAILIASYLLFIMLVFPPWGRFGYGVNEQGLASYNHKIEDCGYQFLFYHYSIKFLQNRLTVPISTLYQIDKARLAAQFAIVILVTVVLITVFNKNIESPKKE